MLGRRLVLRLVLRPKHVEGLREIRDTCIKTLNQICFVGKPRLQDTTNEAHR